MVRGLFVEANSDRLSIYKCNTKNDTADVKKLF